MQEERSKAEQETLVNQGGRLTKAPSVRDADEEPPTNEFIVVSRPTALGQIAFDIWISRK